ncbi:hypothetical protein Syun_013204 [Stephania yunnanensis]|uniref:RING-type E3 ubiquitin transferase n=1 Tax=Stephania yunnanensis TaxID=152371 RepID=A0AAP0K1N4_9MAGN
MGGCCCCSSRSAPLDETPVYYYCPQAHEEREPLSSSNVPPSVLSTGLFVDTNLDTSSPDTYRAPPAPMPYDADMGRPQTPQQRSLESGSKKNEAVDQTNSESNEETVTGSALETLATCEGAKEVDCKNHQDTVLLSSKESEIESSKLSEPIASAKEEEDCPICLEEYDVENPRIVTKCDHHFHLSCILEWMERSDTCPVCDQETVFASGISG